MSLEDLAETGNMWAERIGVEWWLGPLFPRPVYLFPRSSSDADKARDLVRGAKLLEVP